MPPSEALCVYCRRLPVDPVWRPFCGERCKMADLGRWLGEAYRVPAEAPPDRLPRPDGPGGDHDAGDK